ncbi:uncharacterized protein P884DRAFT_193782 [Thermothelomyces heterothallicus CBS 202.75]|uniref:uncharacterized protein n=1 Tax=Thermothelomyces heterothallicus CBS 202.75 TaxID=1149848 RepID=UPI00374408F0
MRLPALISTALLGLLGSLPSTGGESTGGSTTTSTTTTTTTTTATGKATIILRIPGSPPLLPNPHLLPASTRATLTALGASLSAPLSVHNTFVFPDVPAGSYLVDVHCPTHAFAPLRLDVGAGAAGVRAWETFRGNDWGNKGEVIPVEGGGAPGAAVLDVKPVGIKGYYMERSSFSVLSIFKNPIILLSMVSMALFFGMPKLVENMDPEMRAEWEERQKENPMNALMGAASGQNANPMASFDMAAFLAGSGSSNKAEEGNGKGKGESRKKR